MDLLTNYDTNKDFVCGLVGTFAARISKGAPVS